MSPEHVPPPPPDSIKDTTEKLASFARWIVELIQRRNWFTLLLLLDVAWFFFGNPGVFGQVYKLVTTQDLPAGYLGIFLLILGLIFVAAIAVALITMPRAIALDTSSTSTRRAIKGLRAFGAEDAEIFAKLQRNQSLQDCLDSIARREFRFGILVGESGCGKTSFLQAGLMPRLSLPESPVRGVYVKFSDRPPSATIHADVVDQLQIPPDLVEQADFLTLLAVAVDAGQKPVVLIFDQFEQFFVHQPRKADRQPFIQALQAWYGSPTPPAVKILVSIRADLQYELNSLQQALGYTLSRYEIFQLEKFDPQEATEILRVLAETEDLECDRGFIKELTERELTTSEGKVSPVDLQILAEVVRKQKTAEQRAFSRDAFQKLGGIDGLLNRYLEETLQTLRFQGHESLYQTTIQVLLALTDRERGVRSGVVAIADLQNTVKGATAREIETAVEWLSAGEVRLITPVERNQVLGYELAHERIIPALLRLAGKELKDADRANQLLERRVNEWVGNQKSPRYLLSWQELWLIQRQKAQLTWGRNRRQKEQLLKQSWRRWKVRIGAGIALLVLLLLTWLGSLTPPVQQWQLHQQLANHSRNVTHEMRVEAAIAFAMNRDWERSHAVLNLMQQDPVYTAGALTKMAEVAIALGERDRATQLLDRSYVSKKIQDDFSKARTLSAIADAYGKLNMPEIAKAVLQQARTSAGKIQDDFSKARTLIAIADAYGKLNMPEIVKDVLQQARTSAGKIQDGISKAFALRAIAEAYGKLNAPKIAKAGLQQTRTSAEKMQSDYDKANALIAIAEAYGKLNVPEIAKAELQQARTSAEKMQSDYDKAFALRAIAEIYGKLNMPEIAKIGLEQVRTSAGKIQDDSSKASALRAIAETYGKLNMPEIAKAVLQQARTSAEKIKNDSKADASNAIAETYGKLNMPEIAKAVLQQARTSAEKIKNDSKADALNAIAETYGKLNMPEIAKAVLQQARTSAEKIQNVELKSMTLQAIVEDQCAIAEVFQNQPAQASAILDQAVRAVESIQDLRSGGSNDRGYRVAALASLAAARIKLEDWRQVNQMVGLCASDECRVAVAAKALSTWGEMKHPELAKLRKTEADEE